MWIDQTEGVDDHFAFYGLDGVDYHSYGAVVEGFEGLGYEGRKVSREGSIELG